ncbi:uncharacterized protein LOC126418569 [Schistocerca serialis cubense]|uniref:uncharacterized protein LOC126418569 n=1 Tax=Schistocerca serialis cubense TaxID=2023355 RepID=UPI00214E0B2B|nr:uncharacterized protein LOC126418569 [Schistocerca serialis cubense]
MMKATQPRRLRVLCGRSGGRERGQDSGLLRRQWARGASSPPVPHGIAPALPDMARHVFVFLLVAVFLLQVVVSLPRDRRDADETTETAANILEGIERLASDVSKKTQEFFTADSWRAIQGNATELANKVGSAITGLVEGAATTHAPA